MRHNLFPDATCTTRHIRMWVGKQKRDPKIRLSLAGQERGAWLDNPLDFPYKIYEVLYGKSNGKYD